MRFEKDVESAFETGVAESRESDGLVDKGVKYGVGGVVGDIAEGIGKQRGLRGKGFANAERAVAALAVKVRTEIF